MRATQQDSQIAAVNTELAMLRILELLQPSIGVDITYRSRTNLTNLVRTSDTGIHSGQNREFVSDTLREMEKLGYVEATENAVGKRYSITQVGNDKLAELRSDHELLETRSDLNTQKSRGIGRVKIGATEERRRGV